MLKIIYGKKAQKIKEEYGHRFIGSRFVLTRKPLEEGGIVDADNLESYEVKGRWCLQGHLDPDLDVKALEGKLQSPTLSQMGRMVLMQVLASSNWKLQLGDIKGAFLEADPLKDRFRSLYAHQPPGGIPGLPDDAVIEILGIVCMVKMMPLQPGFALSMKKSEPLDGKLVVLIVACILFVTLKIS